MRNLILILFLSVAIAACNSNDRIYKSNREVLKETHLLKSFSEELQFIPDAYTQIATDTVLSNGFHVKINYHSLEHEFVLKSTLKEGDSTVQKHFKNFEAIYQVSKGNTLLATSVIDKKLFYTKANARFLDNAIMQYVWIDYEASNTNSVRLNTSFRIPETENFKDFTLTFFDDGKLRIEEINHKAKTI